MAGTFIWITGAPGKRTLMDDEETPLISVWSVLHPINGLNDLVLGQNTTKSALKSTLSAHLFRFHPLVCLIAIDSCDPCNPTLARELCALHHPKVPMGH